MNLTEPQSGTDLAGIRTIGQPRPDGTWGLKGKTFFIMWRDHDLTENIVHLVLARTEGAPAALDAPKAPPPRGVSWTPAPTALTTSTAPRR